MVKFSNECREKVVLEYLNGGGGTHDLAKKYGIGSHTTILNWVNQYKKYGDKAFDVRSPKDVYDGKFKLEVLEWMGKNRASLRETSLHFDITTPSTILSWKRKFEENGVEALFKQRGRPIEMKSNHEYQQGKNEESSELEKLQRENRLLRIENEYLKKLKALIQESEDTDKSKRK
ncbi:transposase [Neobacillus massiliamazoniensis]|uniref:Transposase n=1 Tax=Neobacillus massiliamazoniensis TaxID=1499688 RepID=A0A0U1P4G9_9BACI|nr:transposase [Neobacillus massiliamazoniensis]